MRLDLFLSRSSFRCDKRNAEEIPEATASLADATQITVDVAVLSGVEGIFTIKAEQRTEL